ncbi:unnamed protein product [Pleuronectes platessa]|uniref:Uncharacterized protein n=1 Tax=Pleuronectes platessa TaxID=8262 RepID=A0A9N7U6G3_PLEPL|nr:unnamed protein product [Pleuronectes platessa]
MCHQMRRGREEIPELGIEPPASPLDTAAAAARVSPPCLPPKTGRKPQREYLHLKHGSMFTVNDENMVTWHDRDGVKGRVWEQNQAHVPISVHWSDGVRPGQRRLPPHSPGSLSGRGGRTRGGGRREALEDWRDRTDWIPSGDTPVAPGAVVGARHLHPPLLIPDAFI